MGSQTAKDTFNRFIRVQGPCIHFVESALHWNEKKKGQLEQLLIYCFKTAFQRSKLAFYVQKTCQNLSLLNRMHTTFILVFSVHFYQLPRSSWLHRPKSFIEMSPKHFIWLNVLLKGHQSGLTAQRCYFSSREHLGLFSKISHYDVISQGSIKEVDFKDLLPRVFVRKWYIHNPINSSRAEQCLVNHIRTVRGRNHDNVFKCFHAIQLSQELSENAVGYTWPSVISTAPTARREGVDFVEENDGWCGSTCFLENLEKWW